MKELKVLCKVLEQCVQSRKQIFSEALKMFFLDNKTKDKEMKDRESYSQLPVSLSLISISPNSFLILLFIPTL